MKFTELSIKGVWTIEPRRFGDERGYFMESFRRDLFEANIGQVQFVQDNESFSTRGVLRGLHMQLPPYSQGKLVRVSQGRVLDVAVDCRLDSETFGRYVAVELSADNAMQLYIPRGFAHGFVVLSDVAQFQYKVDAPYAPAHEVTLRFDEPALGIQWPVDPSEMCLSPKDLKGVSLTELKSLLEQRR